MEKIVYEAYGPGGVAIIIEALTDNRNKAVQEIKTVLAKKRTRARFPGERNVGIFEYRWNNLKLGTNIYGRNF
jgi:hypothetical protein